MYWTILGVTAALLLLYCISILRYRSWLLRCKIHHPGNTVNPDCFFSVIVPARNEAAGIEQCLHAILDQAIPADHFEVIVINDHSTDDTEQIVCRLQSFYTNLRLINLRDYFAEGSLNAYKKKALSIAIDQSRGNWIVTTDADCRPGPAWLRAYGSLIQKTGAVFVAGPVCFDDTGSFLSRFQVLDFLSLQGITAASVSAGFHAMCNGANLAYRKEAFYAVNGFSGIDGQASGDDMFLMHKIKQAFPGKLAYLFSQEAIVHTDPMPDWRSFLNQRIRWASKADRYKDTGITLTLLLVYLVNAFLLVSGILGLFVKNGISNWLVLMGLKTLTEISFMWPVARFYGKESLLVWFPLMQPFHLMYTVVAGWLGKFGKYEWKGRQVY